MSDNTNTITASSLAKRYASDKQEIGMSKTILAAKTILQGINEPDEKVMEIATKVIENFSVIDPAMNIVNAIGQAMEYTVIEYTPADDESLTDSSPEPKQMELGLTRGQDALFGARRVVRALSTIEEESAKVNETIARRTERREHSRGRGNAPRSTNQAASKQPGASTRPSNSSTTPKSTKSKAAPKRSPKKAESAEVVAD